MSAKTYDGQTAKLIGRVAENMPPLTGDEMQGWIDDPIGLQKFLSRMKIVLPLLLAAGSVHLDAMRRQPTIDFFHGSDMRLAEKLSFFDQSGVKLLPADQPETAKCWIQGFSASRPASFREYLAETIGASAETTLHKITRIFIARGHALQLQHIRSWLSKLERLGSIKEGRSPIHVFFLQTAQPDQMLIPGYVFRCGGASEVVISGIAASLHPQPQDPMPEPYLPCQILIRNPEAANL